MLLVVCSTCHRHISADAACPFCARDEAASSGGGRTRGLAAMIGASLLGVACSGSPTARDAAAETAPTPVVVPVPPDSVAPIPTPTPVVVPVPPYGVAPIPTPTPEPKRSSPPDAGARVTPPPRPAVPAYGMPPRSPPARLK